ncbi:hypothetical protein GCM10023201_33140 [Actinomycetospora corticicola]
MDDPPAALAPELGVEAAREEVLHDDVVAFVAADGQRGGSGAEVVDGLEAALPGAALGGLRDVRRAVPRRGGPGERSEDEVDLGCSRVGSKRDREGSADVLLREASLLREGAVAAGVLDGPALRAMGDADVVP